MRRKVFPFRDFSNYTDSYCDHRDAVEQFCDNIGEDKVVSITGDPRCVSAIDQYSSHDGKGRNYLGCYVVWYKEN